MQFGLLGRKLSHSYSPQIHSFFGDYKYELFEKEPQELENFFKNKEFKGINVTIPYKKDVIKYCDELSDVAKQLGSVNTIVNKNGRLLGYNTDYFGFSYMIKKAEIEVENKKAIVLGSGGASVTCQAVLKNLGAKDVVVISRNGENNYNNLYKHFDAQIIVNSTPVGMYPNVNDSIIDLADFKNCEGVLDLIYNPNKTVLLKQAQSLGIKFSNGLSMLIAQAKQSVEKFFDKKIDDKIIKKAEKEFKL